MVDCQEILAVRYSAAFLSQHTRTGAVTTLGASSFYGLTFLCLEKAPFFRKKVTLLWEQNQMREFGKGKVSKIYGSQ